MLRSVPHPTRPPADRPATLPARALTPWGRHLAAGALDGYTAGPPPGAVELCMAIDKEVAESDCPACGVPCDWRPFHRPGSYLSYSVCPVCGRFWSI